jgi:UDP-MurNAc hydroxylase
MEFQIVSHACATFRAGSVQLVVDPWLKGPVYWGAWWHCPMPVYDEDIFEADFVYITHWHFDHLHEESLRHFDKGTHFLVPRFPFSIMADTLRGLGFTKVTELEHGETFALGEDFRITSYQIAYQDDSCCFIEGDGVVVANMNDCKPLPRTWKRFLATYPKVDFMFRSHSPAWSYPSCYTFDDPSEAIPVTRESYTEAWRSAMNILKPTYGIPFASMVCHPHPDVLSENDEMVSAFDLEAYLEQHPLEATKMVMMPPGSRWSSAGGFELKPENAVRDPRAYVEQHAEENRGWLEEQAASERGRTLAFETFKGFFRDMFGCGAFLPARPFLKIKFVFVVEADGRTEYWSADFRSGKIERAAEEPPGATSVIRVDPAVLDDALRQYTFTNIDISKRWKVHVRRGGVMKHLLGWVLISLYEAGYLKLANLCRWRFVSGVFRRRSEVLDYLRLCITMLRKDKDAAAKVVTEPV